ncbi:MAG: DUF4411 family protein [Burkholderiaceae bacterium]|nr:DUF4411 family protein [Burkholderiaceae bacterium]
MSYLLDANVFIQAKNLYYGLDFCPAFWEWISANNTKGQVISIDKVFDEIIAGEDELTDWVKNVGNTLFRPTNTLVITQLTKVSDWAMTQNYEPGAINDFFQGADYYLIGHALAGTHIVVTHEVVSNSTKRIKIPNACAGLNVKFMTPYEMLRRENARFVLGVHNINKPELKKK